MKSPATVLWLATVILLPAATLGSPPAYSDAGPQRWEDMARAQGLGAADIEKLRRGKVLITNQAFKQVFKAYMGSRLPMLITSDSLLNAFHVLYEESILRLETANARRLAEILRFIWANLQTADAKVTGRPELAARAKRRAMIYLGTALGLLGDETVKLEEDPGAVIADEVQRITAAKARMKPPWLGEPDDGFMGLDYSRYRPRGFYTKTEGLKRYFRALSWLQSVPFRVHLDEELLSALMIGDAISTYRFGGDREKAREYRRFFRQFREFMGMGDDWDILVASEAAGDPEGPLALDLGDPDALTKKRALIRKLGEKYGLPEINDTVVPFPPMDGSKVAEPNFRVASAYRIPDSVLFFRTTDLRSFGDRDFPTGLEVCTALGSSFARAKLSYRDKDRLLETIEGCRDFFKGSSLYLDYLQCLAALLDEPERGAPAFMSGEPWQAKSCQTALAGWAQLRHTWALQAKQSADLGAWVMAEETPDVVEPDPEFFARMGKLVARTRGLLKESGALEADLKGLAHEIRDLVAWMDETGMAKRSRFSLVGGSDRVGWLRWLMYSLDIESCRKAMERLTRLADDFEMGRVPEGVEVARLLPTNLMNITPFWQELALLCHRLELFARKELRGEPFDENEKRFLKEYGKKIAAIMLYGGNSYLHPRDDAPRVMDVHYNPNVWLVSGRPYLLVGIARPRAIYVLYPGKKGEYICRGAVLPYYEFAGEKRMTDGEWKALLDGQGRPEIPPWVESIVGEGGIGKATLRGH